MIEKINAAAQKVIDNYANLDLGGKAVTTPYFINDSRRKDLRAMVGKGTPEEIIMEARIWEKLKGIDFATMSSMEIKQFLIDRGLGIDCSGFIIHVLDGMMWHKKKNHIWKYLKTYDKSIYGTIRYLLRPVEQLGAEVITDDENSIELKVNNISVGDVIRSKAKKSNGHHIMLVTNVEREEKSGDIKMIQYTHSSPYYGNLNGVKTGDIRITDPNKKLEEQQWLEIDEHGVNHTFEGFMLKVEDNGPRRLRCFI